MGLGGALRTGVAGLGVQSQALAAASDNISNANTTSYKATRVSFSTLVTTQATSNSFAPGAVSTSVRREVSTQGLIQSTQQPTDCAVSGSGFFAVTNSLARNATSGQFESSGSVLYSRAGEFRPDQEGNLQNAQGFYLLGWPANAELTDFERTNVASSFVGINVGGQSVTPTPSTDITISANLAANQVVGESYSVSIQLFDRQGIERSIQLDYVRQASSIDPTGTLPDQGRFDVNTDAANSSFIPKRNGEFRGGAALAANDSNLGDDIWAVYARILPTNTTEAFTDIGIVRNAYIGQDNAATAGVNDTGTLNTPSAALTPLANAASATAAANTGVLLGALTFGANGTLSGLYPARSGTETPAALNFTTLTNSTGQPAAVGDILDTTGLDTRLTFRVSYDNEVTATDADDDVSISIDFGSIGQTEGITQFNGANTLNSFSQNGRQFGTLQSVSLGSNAVVTTLFDNGETRNLYQLPITRFNNPNQLTAITGNVYLSSATSGQAIAGISNQGGTGDVVAGSLEASAVDLATEFTEIILAQRFFSANTRTITSADQLLTELVQIVR